MISILIEATKKYTRKGQNLHIIEGICLFLIINKVSIKSEWFTALAIQQIFTVNLKGIMTLLDQK